MKTQRPPSCRWWVGVWWGKKNVGLGSRARGIKIVAVMSRDRDDERFFSVLFFAQKEKVTYFSLFFSFHVSVFK